MAVDKRSASAAMLVVGMLKIAMAPWMGYLGPRSEVQIRCDRRTTAVDPSCRGPFFSSWLRLYFVHTTGRVRLQQRKDRRPHQNRNNRAPLPLQMNIVVPPSRTCFSETRSSSRIDRQKTKFHGSPSRNNSVSMGMGEDHNSKTVPVYLCLGLTDREQTRGRRRLGPDL